MHPLATVVFLGTRREVKLAVGRPTSRKKWMHGTAPTNAPRVGPSEGTAQPQPSILSLSMNRRLPFSFPSRMSNPPRTVTAAAVALLLSALTAVSLSFAQSGGGTGFGNGFNADFRQPTAVEQDGAGGIRYREGTKLVDRAGHFRVQGDQVFYYIDDDQHRFTGLPNLNLERVALAITDDASQLEWSVTGVVTEYRGTNYILVERAILKTKGARAARRD